MCYREFNARKAVNKLVILVFIELQKWTPIMLKGYDKKRPYVKVLLSVKLKAFSGVKCFCYDLYFLVSVLSLVKFFPIIQVNSLDKVLGTYLY